jgi:hypothetical protein
LLITPPPRVVWFQHLVFLRRAVSRKLLAAPLGSSTLMMLLNSSGPSMVRLALHDRSWLKTMQFLSEQAMPTQVAIINQDWDQVTVEVHIGNYGNPDQNSSLGQYTPKGRNMAAFIEWEECVVSARSRSYPSHPRPVDRLDRPTGFSQ